MYYHSAIIERKRCKGKDCTEGGKKIHTFTDTHTIKQLLTPALSRLHIIAFLWSIISGLQIVPDAAGHLEPRALQPGERGGKAMEKDTTERLAVWNSIN